MKTYEVNQLDGRSFNVNNVVDIWDSEHGVNFQGEGGKTIAFIPFKNLANYQLVNDKPITNSITTNVDGITISSNGPVTINSNKVWNAEEAIKFTELVVESFVDGLKQKPKVGR